MTDQPADSDRLVLPNEAFGGAASALDDPGQPVPELVELFRRPRATPPADAYESDPESLLYETDSEPPLFGGQHGTCAPCGQLIVYIDSPFGGWWAHEVHPADDHDAVLGGPA